MRRQIWTQRLDHHALTWRHLAQHCKVIKAQCPGVCMRQQTGFIQHHLAHSRYIFDGSRVTGLGEPLLGHRVPILG